MNENRLGRPIDWITQASHGLTVGMPVRFNGSAWVASLADTPANAKWDGVVVRLAGSNAFALQTSGRIIFPSAILTAGSVHFVSSTVAGSLVTTAPANMARVLFAETTKSGILLPRTPIVTVSTSAPGSTAANDGDIWLKY